MRLDWHLLSGAEKHAAQQLGMGTLDGRDWPDGPAEYRWRDVQSWSDMTQSLRKFLRIRNQEL